MFPPVAELPLSMAPWECTEPNVNFVLTKYNKRQTPVAVIRQEFSQVAYTYRNCRSFFTDGTKTDSCVGSAVVSESWMTVRRLDSKSSIFTAELYALILAVDFILENDIKNSIVYSDSLSALKAISSLEESKNAFAVRLRNKVHTAVRPNFALISVGCLAMWVSMVMKMLIGLPVRPQRGRWT